VTFLTAVTVLTVVTGRDFGSRLFSGVHGVPAGTPGVEAIGVTGAADVAFAIGDPAKATGVEAIGVTGAAAGAIGDAAKAIGVRAIGVKGAAAVAFAIGVGPIGVAAKAIGVGAIDDAGASASPLGGKDSKRCLIPRVVPRQEFVAGIQ